jgi:hypothetical protein
MIRITIPTTNNNGQAIGIALRAVLGFPPASKNSLLFIRHYLYHLAAVYHGNIICSIKINGHI